MPPAVFLSLPHRAPLPRLRIGAPLHDCPWKGWEPRVPGGRGQEEGDSRGAQWVTWWGGRSATSSGSWASKCVGSGDKTLGTGHGLGLQP